MNGEPATAPPYGGPERRVGLPKVEPFVERRHGTPPYGLDRSRSSGLDGLRVFAALFVTAFHLKTVSGVSFGPLDPIVQGGDSGVYLFFALSGYLLYKPFVRGSVDLVGFGLKRAGRILPGYYVALIGLTILTGARLPLEHPLPFLSMSASYNIPLRGFLGNAWTLSAEILFYVTLPFIANLARGREVPILVVLGVISASLGTLQRLALNDGNAWMFGTYPLVFYAFVPGMLLAVLEVRHRARFDRLHGWPVLAMGVGLIVFGALTTILPFALSTGIGTVLVMAWVLHHPLPWPRALSFGGGASYALYLWHKDAIIAFGPAAGIAVALVASGLSWALVEHPILARVHALVASRRQPGQTGHGQPVPITAPPAS
jgi:peptidoglycan/LPS O-acetylase OafA/YrhL